MLHICTMLPILVPRPKPVHSSSGHRTLEIFRVISYSHHVCKLWVFRHEDVYGRDMSWWFLHSQLNQRRVLPLRNPIALRFGHLMTGEVENQATQVLMDALLWYAIARSRIETQYLNSRVHSTRMIAETRQTSMQLSSCAPPSPAHVSVVHGAHASVYSVSRCLEPRALRKQWKHERRIETTWTGTVQLAYN